MLSSFIDDLKTFAQNSNRHFVISTMIVSLLLAYLTLHLSQSIVLAALSFLLAIIVAAGFLPVFNFFIGRTAGKEADKTTVLLVSQDEEIASQIRYLLSHDHIHIEWRKTYDSTTKYLKQKKTDALILDTNNKPKNTANLVELCRSHQTSTQRLPIIAIQKSTASEKKRQLLLEGFDDCLPSPVKQQDIETFYARWLEGTSASVNHNIVENDNTEVVVEAAPNISTPKTQIFDKQQALIQSHQNASLAKDMLTMLVKMIAENRANIRQHYEAQNWEALNEITHKIKGGCYCTGMPSLEKAMVDIDKALEKKELDNIPKQFESMMSEINAVIDWHEEHDLDILFGD